ERASVLDLLFSDLSPARLYRRIVLIGGVRTDHAARTEGATEVRKILLRGIVVHLRLFLGIEMIEIAEELVEAVVGRQHVVEIAEVVFAELPGRITLILESRGDCDGFFGHSDRSTRHTDLGQAGAKHALSCNERGTSGRAGLLPI